MLHFFFYGILDVTQGLAYSQILTSTFSAIIMSNDDMDSEADIASHHVNVVAWHD